VLPFGGLWYCEVSDAIDYAKFYSRSRDAVIRVYDAAGNVIDTYEHAGDFKRAVRFHRAQLKPRFSNHQRRSTNRPPKRNLAALI
jgi:hypothetical protein